MSSGCQCAPRSRWGSGTPRETLAARPLGRRDRARSGWSPRGPLVDHTDGMNRWAASGSRSWRGTRTDLCGYVLKKDSPSCGMERVKTYATAACPSATAVVSTRPPCMRRFPALPVEEEGRLNDPTAARELHRARVRVSPAERPLQRPGWSLGALVKFHTAHKMALLAHSTTALQRARPARRTRRRRCPSPSSEPSTRPRFMSTLQIVATVRRHTNVLTHMMGHLKKQLDPESKRELLESIDEYRHGARAPRRAADPPSPLRPPSPGRIPCRTDLPRPLSARAHASQQRLRPERRRSRLGYLKCEARYLTSSISIGISTFPAGLAGTAVADNPRWDATTGAHRRGDGDDGLRLVCRLPHGEVDGYHRQRARPRQPTDQHRGAGPVDDRHGSPGTPRVCVLLRAAD